MFCVCVCVCACVCVCVCRDVSVGRQKKGAYCGGIACQILADLQGESHLQEVAQVHGIQVPGYT